MDCGPIRPGEPEPDEGDVVEARAFDGTVVSRMVVPRTGLAGPLRRDPVVSNLVDRAAADLAYLDAEAIGRPSTHTRPTLFARYWAWNERAFAWLVAGLRSLWNWRVSCRGAAAVISWGIVAYMITQCVVAEGLWWRAYWVVLAVFSAGATLLTHYNAYILRRDWAAACELVAELEARAARRWQDVELVEFAPVCACPACGAQRLHFLAAADTIPDTDVTFERLVVWRECAAVENGCRFVWPQLQ